ncbi:MAG: hypothetical protein DI637_13630 [Citromicrobium sp.]|nr:MAG: hypothetical protein DI637_13630 [Citromicrobium sp.]
MTNFLTPLAILLMQVGPNPATGGMPGIPDELANRPPRAESRSEPQPAQPQSSRLGTCLREASAMPQSARDTAQRWREEAASDLDLAQSAHCLGLALVGLQQYDEARQTFELASGEAPPEHPAYAARLAAMAGNAAVAGGNPEAALPLLDTAGGRAEAAGDKALQADLRVDLARVLVRLGRVDDAAAALAEARAADAGDAQAWLLSATLSRRSENLAEAQSQIERAATLEPRDAAIGLEAGVIAAMAGRDADARASFASVIEVAPDSPQAEQAQRYLAQLDAQQ